MTYSKENQLNIKMERSSYARLMMISANVTAALENLTIRGDLDEQTKFDTVKRLESMRWLEQLPSEIEVEVKDKSTDGPRALNADGISLLSKINAASQDETVKQAIRIKQATKTLLREALKDYIKEKGLLRDKEFVYDAFLKGIARKSKGKIGTEDLDVPRTKRDLTALVGCLIESTKGK